MFEVEGRSGIGELAGRARATLTAAAAIDVRSLEAGELRAAVVELERARRALDAAQGHLLAELDERRCTLHTAALATSKWFARHTRVPSGVARDRLSVATTLRRHLPQVDAALARGEIGFEHARVLARAVNDRNAAALQTLTPTLLERAGRCRFEQWRQHVLDFANHLDPDGTHDPTDDVLRNRLTLSPTRGFTLLHGELTGDAALTVEHAIETTADQLFHQHRRDKQRFGEPTIPPRATLRALALVELIRRAQATHPTSTTAPGTELSIILHTDTHPDDPASPTLPDTPPAGPVVTTPHGHRPSRHTTALLLCAALHHALLTTATTNGVPITETDAYRPSRAQRRALEHRDGGCTFPGCDATAPWCDAHHLIPWPNGPTDLSNLALVCRFHHRHIHHHHWTVQLTPDGWTQWTSPTGHRQPGQRHHQERAGPGP